MAEVTVLELRKRQRELLQRLADACHVCVMCDLGFGLAKRNGDERNPHVFSNLNPARIVVVGQNPGWNEVVLGEPFVGDAGANFDAEIAKHDVARTEFYISNAVKCFTPDNTRPTQKHLGRCEPFLRMELNILQPKLVVALGSVAFSQLCPDVEFAKSLKSIVKSAKYGVPVFALYHPSPLNFRDGSRRAAFEDQVRVLCGLVKALR